LRGGVVLGNDGVTEHDGGGVINERATVLSSVCSSNENKHYDNTVRIICMDCPRCGGTVITYQLDHQESYVCNECEYVGIDVDHGARPEEVESWDEAMMRFYERGSGGRASDGATSGKHGIGTGSGRDSHL
jgi:transposase-like protein